MTTGIPETQVRNKVRISRFLAWAAIVLPLILAPFGAITAFKAGELVTYLGFGWLAAAIIIDFILKSHNALTKANGRIIVGAVTFIVGIIAVINSYQDDRMLNDAKSQLIEEFMKSSIEASNSQSAVQIPAKEITHAEQPSTQAPLSSQQSSTDKNVNFISQIAARGKKFIVDISALNRKESLVDMGTILNLEHITTKKGIQESRKQISYMQSLVNERYGIVQRYFLESESFIKTTFNNDVDRSEALRGLNENREIITQNYANLQEAQTKVLKVYFDFLDLFESALGHTKLQGEQIMFQTQEDLDKYQLLSERMQEAASFEDTARKRVEKQSVISKKRIADEYRK